MLSFSIYVGKLNLIYLCIKTVKIGATLYATPSGFAFVFFVAFSGVWGFESALSTPSQAAPCGAPVSAAVQLRRGRSPLHRRAILWRPSGAREFGGRAPANMAYFSALTCSGWVMPPAYRFGKPQRYAGSHLFFTHFLGLTS